LGIRNEKRASVQMSLPFRKTCQCCCRKWRLLGPIFRTGHGRRDHGSNAPKCHDFQFRVTCFRHTRNWRPRPWSPAPCNEPPVGTGRGGESDRLFHSGCETQRSDPAPSLSPLLERANQVEAIGPLPPLQWFVPGTMNRTADCALFRIDVSSANEPGPETASW
jgi:hypothetical protein